MNCEATERLEGCTQYVTQTGMDGKAAFLGGEDYRRYLRALREASLSQECAVHAYTLAINTVHLLVTAASPDHIEWMMQELERTYVRWVSQSSRRELPIWQGAYTGNGMISDDEILEKYCCIEHWPIRCGSVRYASQYRWSSFLCNAMGCSDPLVQHHNVYWYLGETDCARQQAYRTLFRRFSREGYRRLTA